MTPPATVAGRRRATGARSARSGGGASGRPPRRVSGPARPSARAAAPAPAPAQPRTSVPRTARRTSGASGRPIASDRPIAAFGGRLAAAAATALPLPLPTTRPSAPPRQRPRPVARPARRPELPLGARALAWLRALPDHRLLDRLIGGRIWIVLLGTLLVGIVTMQLSLLRMNAGIGRAVERSSALEQSNAALRLENSRLSDSERVVALATQMGYVMPPQGSPRFLSASAADAGKALTTMRVPDPSLAAASAAEVVAATPDPATTTSDPSVVTTPIDPAAATTAPETTATTAPASATTTPAAGTTAPATGTVAPVTSSTPVAGGASAPQG